MLTLTLTTDASIVLAMQTYKELVVWFGMVIYGMVWYGMVWYSVAWHGMVWYGIVRTIL